jgi:DNA polymerase-1
VANCVPTIGIVAKSYDVTEANKLNLMGKYLQPLAKEGLKTPAQCIEFIGLEFPKVGNLKKQHIVENTEALLEYCDTIGISTLLVTDAKHFCYLSGRTKAEDSIGNTYKCVVSGFEHISILPAISPVVVNISPAKAPLYYRALSTLAHFINGTYEVPGKDVIRDAKFPTTITDIRQSLKDILYRSEIGVDIETYGDNKGDALRWERGFLGSIAFSPDKHSGVSFLVGDYFTGRDYLSIKNILKGFFDNYEGKLVLHNGLFDAKFLIRHLYMNDLNDYKGMYEGIKVFSRMDDTMIMAYACINSTERLGKGLKELSKEFTGEYAEDVKDIKLLSKENLLRYNLMDTCGTMYLYDKYSKMIIEEEQREVYDTILQPSFGFLLEMMMTGLPIDMERTLEAQTSLTEIQEEALSTILSSKYVHRAEGILKRLASNKYNETHKVKQKTPDEIELTFNPGSGNQLRVLLFDVLHYDVIEKTDTGQPSVGGAVIKEYLAIAKNNQEDDVVELLTAILDFGSAIKVNGTFINAIVELSIEHPNGDWFLNGNLKMGGTQSGRLSSSEP